MAATDDVYQDLPTDPEKAFLVLERAFRNQCLEQLNLLGEHDDPSLYQVEYIGSVIAAITELGLDADIPSVIPDVQDVSTPMFMNFSKNIRSYCTRLEIRHGRRAQGFTVRFDEAVRSEIHNYITKIRTVVTALEISEPRKEALLKRLEAFSSEVDRNRTRLESFGEMVLQVSSIAGEAAEKLEPVRKFIDSIANLINGARALEEDIPRLPTKPPQKRIEGKKPVTNFSRDLDDEVPF